jgi:Zn-dependent protease with chaperone function/tetratricopeptide (TPR) repeat protein
VKITRLITLVCVLLLTTIIPSSVLAQDDLQEEPPERDLAFEQEVYDRLTVINPDAVPIFQQATQAMDADDLVAAKQGYEQVLNLAPDFPDALRRLSYIELGLGNVESGVQHARQAFAVEDTPYNRYALANALLTTEEPDNEQEALTHAWAAVEALPDDGDMNLTLLYAGMVNEDMRAVRQASETLVEVMPDYPFAHYVVGMLAADDGKWELAERELLLAQELGMQAEEIQQVLDDGVASQARLYRTLRRGGYAIAVWLVELAVLFVMGIALSRLTLETVQRTQTTAQFEVGRGERIVRVIYRIVIALTSIYFYVSIPFVIFIVVAVAVGAFYFFFAVGRIPLQLAAALVIGTIYTLIAIVRSIFAWVKDEEPGRPLSRDEAPRLWSLAEEVAERVGTRPVDAIYVTPAPSIAVTERGGLLQKLRGAGQRCLILGLGALPEMTQGQFKAILAHEYGHFSNRDTAGGNLARQVQFSMNRMAYSLAANGQALWYNPAWLFVNGFNRIFLRITLGASRLQEILADRYAALAYGVENFVNGLTYIVRQSLLFEANVSHKADLATRLGKSLPNLYVPAALPDPVMERLEAKIDEEMSRPTSAYDSHPSPQERIRLLRQLDVVSEVAESQEPVWDLLADAEKLQDEMITVVQADFERWKRARAVQEAQRR